MASDVADLRALLAGLDLPLKFEAPDTVVSGGSEIVALGFFVSTHALGFVAVVNALPSMLDRVEAVEKRLREMEAIIADADASRLRSLTAEAPRYIAVAIPRVPEVPSAMRDAPVDQSTDIPPAEVPRGE